MINTFEVIKPFGPLEMGDTLTLNENGYYESEVKSGSEQSLSDGLNITSEFTSSLEVSADVADKLVKEGYLAYKGDNTFVNVFDEIDNLLGQYEEELKNNKELEFHPAVSREREVVYTNLITVLNHLKSLKK